jgi:hypothetical protein
VLDRCRSNALADGRFGMHTRNSHDCRRDAADESQAR